MTDTATPAKVVKPRYTGDLTLIGASDEKAPPRASADLRSYVEQLTALYNRFKAGDTETARGFYVHKDAASVVGSRFRQAADKVNCGVTFTVIAPDDSRWAERGYSTDDPNLVRVIVSARARRDYKPREKAEKPEAPKTMTELGKAHAAKK